jgi:hypothetical protein
MDLDSLLSGLTESLREEESADESERMTEEERASLAQLMAQMNGMLCQAGMENHVVQIPVSAHVPASAPSATLSAPEKTKTKRSRAERRMLARQSAHAQDKEAETADTISPELLPGAYNCVQALREVQWGVVAGKAWDTWRPWCTAAYPRCVTVGVPWIQSTSSSTSSSASLNTSPDPARAAFLVYTGACAARHGAFAYPWREGVPLDTAATRAAHPVALLRFACGTIVAASRLDALRCARCDRRVEDAHGGPEGAWTCWSCRAERFRDPRAWLRVQPVPVTERGWWCPACHAQRDAPGTCSGCVKNSPKSKLELR